MSLETFMAKVNKTDTCWMWTGNLTAHGYGRQSSLPGSQLAHRAYWLHVHGPLSEGLELDHLCRVRACVNPGHLEAVSHAENVRRGNGGRPKALKCPKGHEYVGDNVYVRPDGKGRGCMACRTISNSKRDCAT